MLFEIHDIILHRLWKAAKSLKRSVIHFYLDSPIMLPFQPVAYHTLRKLERLTRRLYMNHQPRLSDSMIPYVRVYNGLPW